MSASKNHVPAWSAVARKFHPVTMTIKLKIYPGDVWETHGSPMITPADGSCVVLGETARQIFKATVAAAKKTKP